MASIVLGTLTSGIGTAAASPFTSFLTSQFTQLAGSAIAGAISSKPSKRHTEGARLEELAVQTSTYGRGIASFFGTVRLAGNVIWSLPIKEVATTSTVQSGGKGGGGRRQTVSQTSYSYYVTLAIAIGEGPITRLERVWADAKQLDLSQGTYRIYTGSETQLPDSLIESMEGIGKTPAYRGLAYVVIEDFPLANFGNRIPNFSFEATRDALLRVPGEVPLEEAVRSVVLLPGSGEYVYDAVIAEKSDGEDVGGIWAQQGYRRIINANTASGKADVLVAVDQMLDALPNLEWVSIVVNWFGTSMNLPDCEIFPCVEYNTSSLVRPHAWSVAGYNRTTARVIGFEAGRPRYGGTPDDGSLLRLVTHLKSRGLKVMFLPLLLMDVSGKPWRGELAGDAGDISHFFTKTNGYNRYILHYANLLDGHIDGFAIGSEMKALNAVSASAGVYPAVTQFVSLAASVKAILGTSTKVTYAADWSEYHHTDGGWYHMDPLWASPNIDVIGIDAYFPLTDEPELSITRQKITDGWASGEGYDWYYADEARTNKQPITMQYAWKNLSWWWENTHTNPDSNATAWVPESKPIWFTEIGYASVDGCTNEPNIFVDPSSAASDYPRFSRKRVDFSAQRRALEVAFDVWGASSMVQEMFVWAWDARPYPAWPDLLSVWADGGNWITGHWLQGKLGRTQLDAIVKHLLLLIGVPPERIDVSALKAQVDGLVMHQRTTARAVLEQLQSVYSFDLRESLGRIVASNRTQEPLLTVQSDELLMQEYNGQRMTIEYRRAEESDLPKRLEVRYLDRFEEYGTSIQAATRTSNVAQDTETLSLSLVLNDSSAKLLAERTLDQRWLSRERWLFQLPMRYSYLEVGDSITLQDAAYSVPLLITRMQVGKPGVVKIEAILHQPSIYDYYVAPVLRSDDAAATLLPTDFEVLDIPTLPDEPVNEHGVKFALAKNYEGWPGAVMLRGNNSGGKDIVLGHNVPAIMGTTLHALAPRSMGNVIDETSTLDVALVGDGTLQSITLAQMLGGANAALVGDEIIQFMQVDVIGEWRVRLSRLLRGRLGSEHACSGHGASERFIFLDNALRSQPLSAVDIDQTINWYAVTSGLTELQASEKTIHYRAVALKPYASAHLNADKTSTGDIVFSWKRRARGASEWRDWVDMPLNEARELYRLELYSASNLLRAEEVSSPYFSYSMAQQIADNGGALTSVTAKIWQISEVVGRGYEASKDFSF